jgi:carbonic anhydrase
MISDHFKKIIYGASLIIVLFCGSFWFFAIPKDTVLEGIEEEGERFAAWDYNEHGSHGPEHWGSLSKEFAACQAGHQQSPIDIDKSYGVAPDNKIKFYYKKSHYKIKNKFYSILVKAQENNHLIWNKIPYELKEIHFHTPSEHKVGGVAAPLEMHMVHQNKEGQLLVLGVFLEEGKENSPLKKVWHEFFHESEDNKESLNHDISFNALDLLPSSKEYYSYKGSLTTPPCQEGVLWFVFKKPIYMSKENLHYFRTHFKESHRPVQKIRDRRVFEGIGH